MRFDFSNKTVVVTGASRGIGRGIAQAFSENGARVAIVYQSNDDAAKKVLGELKGDGHKLYKFDVSDPNSVETFIPRISEEMNGIHVLINNAGITRDQLLLRAKSEDWDHILAVNLRSVFLCTKAAVKLMLKARDGAIINMTSVIGETGNPGQGSYAASKAGIIAFTKSIALEVASRNIRLNCIAPGFIESDMTESLSEDQKKAIMTRVPLNCMGQTSDVAAGCLFLASSYARYITGHTLDVNGGLFMN